MSVHGQEGVPDHDSIYGAFGSNHLCATNGPIFSYLYHLANITVSDDLEV